MVFNLAHRDEINETRSSSIESHPKKVVVVVVVVYCCSFCCYCFHFKFSRNWVSKLLRYICCCCFFCFVVVDVVDVVDDDDNVVVFIVVVIIIVGQRNMSLKLGDNLVNNK